MIKVLTNPFLADLVIIAAQLPDDQRKQIEAFSGVPYDIDGAAVGNFIVPGPKWVVKVADSEEEFAAGNAHPIAVGGFVPQRPGVWRDFLLATSEAFEGKNWFHMTRECRRIMDAMLRSGTAHRLECIVPARRLDQRLEKWYGVLGYHFEGIRYGYLADGGDAIAFSRVKH